MDLRSSMVFGVIALMGLFLFGCTSNYTGSGNVTVVAPSIQPGAASVVMFELSFNPSKMTIARGSTVTFTNKDSMAHTVTSDTGTFESGQLTKDQSWAYTFNNAGTYAFHCSIHSNMKAFITVTG